MWSYIEKARTIATHFLWLFSLGEEVLQAILRLIAAMLQVTFPKRWLPKLYHYHLIPLLFSGNHVCAICIHVQLFAKLTNKTDAEFVNGCSMAERLAVNLVIFFTFPCLKSMLKRNFIYDLISASYISGKFYR